MSSESTHSHLPASRVIAACRGVLQDIEISRGTILASLIDNKRSRGWPWPKRSHKHAERLLTDQERSIPRFHRSIEENRAIEISDLAQAAMIDDPTFRVYVTASDFAIMKDYYPREEY